MVPGFFWRTAGPPDESKGTDIRPVAAFRRRCQPKRVDPDPRKARATACSWAGRHGPIRISFAFFYPVRRRTTGSIHRKAAADTLCCGLSLLASGPFAHPPAGNYDDSLGMTHRAAAPTFPVCYEVMRAPVDSFCHRGPALPDALRRYRQGVLVSTASRPHPDLSACRLPACLRPARMAGDALRL